MGKTYRRGVQLMVVVAVSLALLTVAAAQQAGPAMASFEDVGGPSNVKKILDFKYAHAAAWGDANGDGLPDLFFGAFGKDQGPNRLLINNGDGTFSESTQPAVSRDDGRASGAAFADLNNDGHLDLVVVNNWRGNAPGGNQLLQNDGKGNFTDVTAGSGLDVPNFSGRSALILDFDGDGLLDILLQHDMWGGKPGGRRSILLKNMGNMKFRDVTAQAGLPTADGQMLGLGGATGDVNGDGWVDILHVGTVSENRAMRPHVQLYLNNRDGTFRLASNFNFNATFPSFNNSEDWPCGAAIGDINGNGRMDIVVGIHYGSSVEERGGKPTAVRVYMNLGSDQAGNVNWRDITEASGVKALFIKQPHVELQDFNNDGRLDIWSGATMRHQASGRQMPYIHYNAGNDASGMPRFVVDPALDPPGTFQGYQSNKRGGLVNPRYYAASPTVDFDLDGRMDIFGADWAIGNEYNDSALFRNVTEGINHYLAVQVDLGQGAKNRYGVGARVSIYHAGQAGNAQHLMGSQLIEVGNGYCSGRTATVHFGTPGVQTVDIVVQMPAGGQELRAANVPINQTFTVKP